MKRFCQECGKEAEKDDNICVHCGTPLQAQTVNTVKKQQMSKGKKLTLRIIVGLVVFVIGFSVWANSYQSPQAVEKRFDAAVTKKDEGKLKDLLVHEDGSGVSKQESTAFLKLVKQDGKGVASDVTSVASHGKFLWIYEAHKMEVVDQFASYEAIVDGLSFEFNDKEFVEHEKDKESIVYGPIAPGIYTVKAVFSGEYGETTMEDTLTLASRSREYTLIPMDVPVSKVVFQVENYEQFDTSTAYIQLNDEKILMNEAGKTKKIGPFILDGSQEVKTVVTMPWGEIVSEPFKVDDTDMWINADLISQDQYKEAVNTLKDFGEQYVEAMAKKSIKPFKSVSADVKENLAGHFYDDSYYSGKFNSVDIYKNTIYIDSDSKVPVFNVTVQYMIEYSHHELTESPEFYDDLLTWNIGLSYDMKGEKWTITSLGDTGHWGDFDDADKVDGSKKVHGPSKESIANAENEEMEVELQAFFYNYTQASVDAINYRDFDLVSEYITQDGPRRTEAREYIDYLESKDIYESWYGSELEKVELVDDNTWKVTVIEEFEILKPDSSNVKVFRTTLIIKRIDKEFYVNELTETNEI